MHGRCSQRPVRRATRRAGATLALVGLLAVGAGAGAAAAPAHRHPGTVTQRGATLGAPLRHAAAPASGGTPANVLTFGGGSGPAGVVTGSPKVYLVVWGPGWDTTGDPQGEVPLLTGFFSGLGTPGDGWSGILAQYCQSGPAVREPINAAGCAAGTTPVSVPVGGSLAGVWRDPTGPATQSPTANDLAKEAVAAALHIGDTSPNAVYVILSAPGTHPDGFNSGLANDDFCGWHDFTADTPLVGSAPGPDVAFINMPYVTDAGFACGARAVNAGPAGALDGVSIVAGHEYSEWMTDPFPGGGWTNAVTGNETADECMWIPAGHQGAMTDITLATGSFAMQSTWSNRGDACVTTATTAVRVAPARTVSTRQSVPVTFGLRTTGPSGRPLIFSARGLPRGMHIDAHTGRISGRPTGGAGTYTLRIAVTDTLGPPATRALTWHIAPAILVSRPATLSTARFTTATVRLRARDLVAHRHLRFRAGGLPAGLHLDPASGRITGTVTGPRRAYLVQVAVTDNGGAWTATRFTWRVR